MQEYQFQQVATRVSLVSILSNTVLTIFKLMAGILAHSGAMVSDAVHSASDVFSSFIVIIGVKLSARQPDDSHPYGHERFECVAAILLSMVLAVIGIFIGKGAVDGLASGVAPEIPGRLALIAAVVSIVVKEVMYHYTVHHARAINSAALMGEAWHHRSDALSSVGALVGVAGARLGYAGLDAVASLVICLFIFKAAYDIFRDAADKLVDHAGDEALEEQLRDCVLVQEGVRQVDLLRTRVFGSRIYVDLEIAVDGALSIIAGHAIAETVHDAIEEAFPMVKHIMIHVNPDEM